jgi:hypothetical protein
MICICCAGVLVEEARVFESKRRSTKKRIEKQRDSLRGIESNASALVRSMYCDV